MKRALLAVRREARDDLREETDGKGKVDTPDYLAMLSEYARPKDRHWVNVTRVVALSRMLERIGTVEATRGLVELYARFGEFLRVDTQLALGRRGDKALAALIEARRLLRLHAGSAEEALQRTRVQFRRRRLVDDRVHTERRGGHRARAADV